MGKGTIGTGRAGGFTAGLAGFLAKRLLQAGFVAWAAFSIGFVVLFVLPGDAVQARLSGAGEGTTASAEQIALLRAQYGLDEPAIWQYLTLAGRFLTGDFGASFASGQPVAEALQQNLPNTLALTGLAFVIAVVLAITIAFASILPGLRWIQALASALPPLFNALPTFWLGLLLIQLFSFKLMWLPAFGSDGPRALILPALTLAIPSSAAMAQVLTRSLAATLQQLHIRTARARGLSWPQVILRHGLRNASVPFVTMSGLAVGSLLGGSVVTETVFSRQGLGRLLQQGVLAQEVNVVLTVVVFCALAYSLANLLVDLALPLLDPRTAPGAAHSAEPGQIEAEALPAAPARAEAAE